MKKYLLILLTLLGIGFMGQASAETAVPWQLGLQEAVTPLMHEMDFFHDFINVIILIIALFILVLLIYICVRFSAKKHPKSNRFSHNTKLEIIWTTVPVLVLLVIAVPSFRLLYFANTIPKSEMTLKIVGHQWYWEYIYPDHGNIQFDSYMIAEKDLKPGQKRLLEVDNQVVIPVDTTIRLQFTSADVIHAWAVPAFGVKTDTIPGRLNESWVHVEKIGTYYGQCSELCGVLHGFMPIAVKVVSKEEFAAWIASQSASLPQNTTVASISSR